MKALLRSTAGQTPEGFYAPLCLCSHKSRNVVQSLPLCFHFRSRFQLLSHHDIVLSVALTSHRIHSELLERISANSALKEKMLKRSTSLQVSAASYSLD